VKRLPSWKGSGTDGQGEGHEDVLVVPGDISSSLERSAETLTELKNRYDEVFFVVGNHELWLTRRRKSEKDGEDGGSVDKLVAVHRACEDLGVRVDPAVFVVGGGGGAGEEGSGGTGDDWEGEEIREGQEVGVFPLLSWYHASWDNEPDLPKEDQFRRGDFTRRWADYMFCRWPKDVCSRE
ncbi:unnamed protein product, partial [Laminaria digitata]